ncbi:MAG: YgeY family selenium metabolism-linked hydrolase [Chloroflexi bacterium]|nr:YgeY family selenium metabolism-linked hydrolase [Ardenticatenaceae bacterium]MBL1128911.1 YgeY family selenium metabolism-linked hydrolase [Chloroflexota bacterium]NOG34990.1 YgeY family selenium metabolism-linked hydrolase [Chloroflexota bacterium]GIK55225.1 MAG: selenium metabolism hydrolase [Chloroflexota bacterium]
MEKIIQQLNQKVTAAEEDILRFFREIVAIPSMNSDIEAVGRRIGAEMTKLGYDQVYVDKYGSIVGRIGSGPKTLLYDTHIDTVGIGDPAQWQWDPFIGKVEDGMLYARGALDEKNSTPGMVYGLAFARDLGLLDGFTCYVLGNIEEWCDGVGCAAFHDWEEVHPDFVVIGEPTNMKVYRGHKGRYELEVTCKGKSAHAASNYMGDNAVYKMLPVIEAISRLEETFTPDDFLGIGRITVTKVSSVSPSNNAVPDECTIFIDRRITFGETKELVRAQIEAIIPATTCKDFEIRGLTYREPSHTGAVYEYEQYFPSWAFPEDHPLVTAGRETMRALWPDTDDFHGQGKWDFSTNGNYWAGKLGIPCIGFGPGNEIYAHAVNEHVPLADVVEATKFYGLLPVMVKQEIGD